MMMQPGVRSLSRLLAAVDGADAAFHGGGTRGLDEGWVFKRDGFVVARVYDRKLAEALIGMSSVMKELSGGYL